MYLPYKDIIKLYFKKAIICVDSFHVVEHLNNDLNKVRLRVLDYFDTDSQEYYLLKRFKFLLFDRSVDLDNKGKFNKKFQRFLNYRQILEMMLSIDIDLYNAHHLKERYITFNATSDFDSARLNIDPLINDFIKADIKEFEEFITLQKNWREEIINSFHTYKGRR
jgi:transposase